MGEVDRFYIVYTRQAGKVRLLGKGVKKPNAKLAGNLEPLTYSEIFFAKGKGSGNIIGAIANDLFFGIKENLPISRSVFFTLGILGRIITEEEKDEKIFDLVLKYLESAQSMAEEFSEGKMKEDELEKKMDVLSFGFLLKLLEKLGYGLEFEKCVFCKGKLLPGGNFFSAESGGILCVDCAKNQRQSVKATDESVKLGRIILKNRIRNFSKINVTKEAVDNLKLIVSEEIRWIAP